MFLDHPFGAGHRGNEFLSTQYMPAELLSQTGKRAAHNTFMAALVDQGFPGAIILVSMYGWAFLTMKRLRRLDLRGLPARLGIYRAGIGAAYAGCVVAGLFLNLLKFEAQVWLIALLAALTVVCERALREGSVAPLTAAPATTAPPRRRSIGAY
jgi:O-antigen ligase